MRKIRRRIRANIQFSKVNFGSMSNVEEQFILSAIISRFWDTLKAGNFSFLAAVTDNSVSYAMKVSVAECIALNDLNIIVGPFCKAVDIGTFQQVNYKLKQVNKALVASLNSGNFTSYNVKIHSIRIFLPSLQTISAVEAQKSENTKTL